MPLRLKTKITLATALLVLVVAAVISGLYVSRLMREKVNEASAQAELVAQQVFFHAQQALMDAATAGMAPESAEPAVVEAYVRQALDQSAGLTSIIDASLGYSPLVYEVTITDRQSVALISSDALLPGQRTARRPPISDLVRAGFFEQLRVVNGPDRVHELVLPFKLTSQPFGEIRVAISTVLLRSQIQPVLREAVLTVMVVVLLSTLLAAMMSHFYLRPLAKISAQLDRISMGEAAPAAVSTADELGQVSTKISQIGQQLRGAQEIFTDLRENVNHVMAGLDDGLILFTEEGRAALVSPAVEKFLGVAPEALTGKTVGEIFPAGHPLRDALHMNGDVLAPVAPVEVNLNGASGAASRAIAGVQVIHSPEGAGAIGALLTLRDVESIEQIGSQLQVSERLAALGRVTAGVAHEVKNPLNSMRLWLENLKQTIPAPAPGGGPQPMAQQAVRILDSEIDRLDRVVKTFLDFSRPVELDMKELDANDLLRDVAAVAKPQFAKAGVELHVNAAVEPLHVMGDRQLLKQALLNLTLNALESLNAKGRAEAGRVALACSRRNTAVRIGVEDNGPGIAPEHRAKIFQLYFTTRPEGSGIGLATAFRIAQFHNGALDFESEPGRGATFTMELPSADL